LEKRRRCGWLGFNNGGRASVVWARKNAPVTSCPKSLITPESEAFVEDFLVRRKLGGIVLRDLSAKQVEAFLILEKELAAENSNGEPDTRRDLSKFS
jgi:hypothetical protein